MYNRGKKEESGGNGVSFFFVFVTKLFDPPKEGKGECHNGTSAMLDWEKAEHLQ